jgi:hypothetical protein
MVAGRLQFQKMPEKTGEQPARFVVRDHSREAVAESDCLGRSCAERTRCHISLAASRLQRGHSRRLCLLGSDPAGAAIGSAAGHVGTGAAIGAGTGLVAGSAVGSGRPRRRSWR